MYRFVIPERNCSNFKTYRVRESKLGTSLLVWNYPTNMLFYVTIAAWQQRRVGSKFASFKALPSDNKTNKGGFFKSLSTGLRADLLRGYSSIFHFVNFQFKRSFFQHGAIDFIWYLHGKMRIKKFFQTTPCEVSCLQLWFYCQILIS